MPFSPRYLVVVNLILLALAAYSASSIVGTALAAKLIAPPEVALPPPPPPLEPQASRPEAYYALIPKRDIFNSAKAPEATPPPAPVQQTQLRLKLWGTAVNPSGGSYSIIEDLGARKQGVYGINSPVPGGASVKAIEWDRVVLLHNGRDEILEIEKPTLGGPGRSVPAQMPAVAPPGGIGAADASGIVQTAENEYAVPRTEVDNALENMSQLFTQIRAVPHFEGGESVGFRLFAIRRGSLFDKIGLKNGDILRSINGNPMNDPGKAMTLMQELRDATNLRVEATRNQQPVTLTYSIQ